MNEFTVGEVVAGHCRPLQHEGGRRRGTGRRYLLTAAGASLGAFGLGYLGLFLGGAAGSGGAWINLGGIGGLLLGIWIGTAAGALVGLAGAGVPARAWTAALCLVLLPPVVIGAYRADLLILHPAVPYCLPAGVAALSRLIALATTPRTHAG